MQQDLPPLMSVKKIARMVILCRGMRSERKVRQHNDTSGGDSANGKEIMTTSIQVLENRLKRNRMEVIRPIF